MTDGSYAFLTGFAKTCVWTFFRDIKVEGLGDFPKNRPVLIGSTHANMIVDPGLVVATCPRKIHIWGKQELFANKYVGKMLRSFGVIPVDRKSKNNAGLFKATFETLEEGGIVCLFPEGTSHSLPHIIDLKDGLSWAALEFAKKVRDENATKGSGEPVAMDAVVVPVGITYVQKWRWRSYVLVRYGEPIDVAPFYETFETDAKGSVKKLTATLKKAIEDLTINAPDWDTFNAAQAARRITIPSELIDMGSYVKVNQSFINILSKEDNQEIAGLKKELLDYQGRLDKDNLLDSHVAEMASGELTQPVAFSRLVRNCIIWAIGFPIFAPLFLIHAPIQLLAGLAGRSTKDVEVKSQQKIFTMVFVTPILYTYIAYKLWDRFNWDFVTAMEFMFILPVIFMFYVLLSDERSDTFKEVLANLKMWRALKDPQAKQEFASLIEERKKLQKEIRDVLQDNDNIPDAKYLYNRAVADKPTASNSRGMLNRRKTYTT